MIQYLESIERMFPILIGGYILFKRNFSYLMDYIINTFINIFLKNNIFKPLMGNKNFPILGKGTRPPGAKNCSYFSNGKLAKSYGMPSGHAQSIAFFLTHELTYNHYTTLQKILLIVLCIYMIYSRVKLGCHTSQQVIVGSILGYFFSNIL